MTTVHLPLLASAQIAAPCDRRWEDMAGDDRRRHCSSCDLHVYNIASMTGEEAEAFLREHLPRGRVCGVIYRRTDGTILTADCPVGVARWRRGAAWGVARLGACAAFLLGAVGMAGGRDEGRVRALQPFRSVCEWLNPTAPSPAPLGAMMAGKIACPPPPTVMPSSAAESSN